MEEMKDTIKKIKRWKRKTKRAALLFVFVCITITLLRCISGHENLNADLMLDVIANTVSIFAGLYLGYYVNHITAGRNMNLTAELMLLILSISILICIGLGISSLVTLCFSTGPKSESIMSSIGIVIGVLAARFVLNTIMKLKNP